MTFPAAIPPALAAALDSKGYENLTEVQEAVLAPELLGRDLLVSAKTGSGKTVAFGLTIAPDLLGETQELPPAATPLGLVIAPTRELALQVQRELIWLYRETGAWIASCVGGMDPRAERRTLERGCHIVVGTPGRLRDHIERGALDLADTRAVVLDEADEMLDFGFKEDLEFILDHAPEDRRTLLFSATVPRAITDIAAQYQRDSYRLSTVGEQEQHGDIDYHIHTVMAPDRENAIINLLRFHDAQRTIIFCATREGVNRLASRLGNRGFSTVALSGELSQAERTHALQAVRDGRARVCVATDVAARGIDLPGLELVIHADLPTNSDTLLHRSGRTGRAGQKGICALIAPISRKGRVNRLLRDARIQAEWMPAPSREAIEERDRERLLADPVLTEAADDALLEQAKALLESFGPEQMASAFLRERAKSLPVAEELAEVVERGRKDRAEPREALSETLWFEASAGRKKRVEPRWLLPLICRVGGVTKAQIGAIQIGELITRFEIDAKVAAEFMASVGENGGGEKSIKIRSADGPLPQEARGAPPQRRERKPHRGEDSRPPRRDRQDDGDRQDGERRPYGDKPRRERSESGYSPERRERPDRAERSERPQRPDRPDRPKAYQKRDDRPRPDRNDRPPRKERSGDEDFSGFLVSDDGPKRPRRPQGKPSGPAGKKPFGGRPPHKGKAKPGAKPPFKGKPKRDTLSAERSPLRRKPRGPKPDR